MYPYMFILVSLFCKISVWYKKNNSNNETKNNQKDYFCSVSFTKS